MVEETLKLQSQEMAYQELKNRPNHEAVDNRDDRRRAAGGRSNSLENYYLAIQKDYMYTVGSLNNGSQATRRDTLRKETEKKTRIRRACRYAAESLWVSHQRLFPVAHHLITNPHLQYRPGKNSGAAMLFGYST